MCRLAAYRGLRISLDHLLNTGTQSLFRQSWAAAELQDTTLNADGFGFAWYLNGQPERYASTLPVWSDTNLTGLGKTLHSQQWAAYVRSATPGQPLSLANTQPFTWQQCTFLHNGRIADFNEGPRQRLHELLEATLAAEIQGNTDSEYLFALVKHFLQQGVSVQQAICETTACLPDVLDGHQALVTMILLDGQDIVCCRHAVNGAACPTLYYTRTHSRFADGLLLASERFSEDERWQAVPEHHCLHFTAENLIRENAL